MQRSDTIGKLSKALTAVQSQLKPASKDADNPFFRSKYADLNSVWDAARDLLGKNGLAVIQGNSVGLDNTVIVETILSHESGEWVQSELCLPLAKHDPQGVGSAVTYGRRYGLAAIVGIVADIDDDGNHASGKNNGGQSAQVKPGRVQDTSGLARAAEAAKATVREHVKRLNWKGDDVNKFIAGQFGEEYNYDNINDKQWATVAREIAKEGK